MNRETGRNSLSTPLKNDTRAPRRCLVWFRVEGGRCHVTGWTFLLTLLRTGIDTRQARTLDISGSIKCYEGLHSLSSHSRHGSDVGNFGGHNEGSRCDKVDATSRLRGGKARHMMKRKGVLQRSAVGSLIACLN